MPDVPTNYLYRRALRVLRTMSGHHPLRVYEPQRPDVRRRPLSLRDMRISKQVYGPDETVAVLAMLHRVSNSDTLEGFEDYDSK